MVKSISTPTLDVIRDEDNPQVLVPNWIVEAAPSPTAFRAYTLISAHAGDDGELRTTNSIMCHLAHCSVNTWIHAVRDLVSIGAIIATPIMDGRSCVGNLYTLDHPGTGLPLPTDAPTLKRSTNIKRKKISPAVRLRVYERDGFRCVQCGTSENLTIDHIVALANGGADDESNYQTMCARENSQKGTK